MVGGSPQDGGAAQRLLTYLRRKISRLIGTHPRTRIRHGVVTALVRGERDPLADSIPLSRVPGELSRPGNAFHEKSKPNSRADAHAESGQWPTGAAPVSSGSATRWCSRPYGELQHVVAAFFSAHGRVRRRPTRGQDPGGFIKREGRPPTGDSRRRIIDRSIRPLFPEGFRTRSRCS